MELTRLSRSETTSARTMNRARVLLLADRSQGEQRSIQDVADATGLRLDTVKRWLCKFDDAGLEATLYDKPRPGKITGDVEAHLVTLARSEPPRGEGRWTLRLLASQVVEQGLLDSLSHVAVGEWLRKTNLSLGR